MKSLLKLFLTVTIVTLHFATGCSDKQPQQIAVNGQPADNAQQEMKKKAELSEETLVFYRSLRGKFIPALLGINEKPTNEHPAYNPINARKMLNFAAQQNKLSIIQNIFEVFSYEKLDATCYIFENQMDTLNMEVKNLFLAKIIQAYADNKLLMIHPKTKRIVDQYQLNLARKSFQDTTAVCQENLVMMPPLVKLIALYATEYPLMDGLPKI